MHVLQMIQDGEKFASVNQKDGMVSFHEDPEQHKTCEMNEHIDSSIQRMIALSKKLRAVDEVISCDPVYLAKAGRERPRFDTDDFDTVPQKFNMSTCRPICSRSHVDISSVLSKFIPSIPSSFSQKHLTGWFPHSTWFSSRRSKRFSAGAENGKGEPKNVIDEAEAARGESTMPSRFRYLTKEVPDRPVRWPWLIALVFFVYAWRTVLWELSNWRKVALGIAKFVGYLSKLVLAIIFHFIGEPITALIGCIETTLYTLQSIYFGIVASAPVPELVVVIVMTSTVLAIAEATVPDSVNSQTYLLTIAGILGFAAIWGTIPVLLFWLLLWGLCAFSQFVKKRDRVSSTLPVAAALAAVGEPWIRAVVLVSYLALAITHHSKKVKEGNIDVEVGTTVRKLPLPLFGAALVIGIHLAAKWIRFRHLTWMIV
ncbi:hypothetical protein NE237_007462 [Protea cynaroides]|uniref:Uncharacterized protein n=1 Tax=Protea cynaroides TaxID=273540 RepID=A0A9Q0KPB6_9MAGN|nr:hypothetical protein NE237_007462 [Protea cynaroides]